MVENNSIFKICLKAFMHDAYTSMILQKPSSTLKSKECSAAIIHTQIGPLETRRPNCSNE